MIYYMIMKRLKLFFLILLFTVFLPGVVSAKEYCKVVSGDGKSIGSEISCGTEHFYIIDSSEEELKLLAKYNLYTGYSVYKEAIEKDSEDQRTDLEYCQELATSRGGTLKTGGVYEVPGYCFIELPIDVDEIKQNENAISAHWDADENYLYPQVGDVYLVLDSLHTEDDISKITDSSSKYEGLFYDYSLVEGKNVYNIINSYKELLSANGYDVNDITLLTLDEVNDVIKSNDKTVSYSDWYDSAINRVNTFGEFVFLQDYLPEKHNFLYNTTYWIRTGYNPQPTAVGNNLDYYRNEYVLFIDSKGGVCESGFNITGSRTICGATMYGYLSKLGCGVRPVIVIPNELLYIIKTVTDGNGTIDVIENSLGGERISFKVNAKRGYNLMKLVITTDSGEVVEFEDGDILGVSDGIVSIDGNKFTMPFENVTIEAKWKQEVEENPLQEVSVDDPLQEVSVDDPVQEESSVKQDPVENPATGDKVILYVAVLLLGALGLGGAIMVAKKRKHD